MKSLKLGTVICTTILLISHFSIENVFADEIIMDPEEEPRSAGLIDYGLLSISSGIQTVYLNAEVYGTATMAELGFKDISIQRSSNGSSGWTEEKTIADDIAEYMSAHKIRYKSVSVSGGYYYRVELEFYAKETGWFFPSSESFTGYSNVVWVSS
jgi:hypothetical protein